MTENVEQELLVVPLALMNDILAYLGTKPYTEVSPYIIAIQKDSKLVPKPPVTKEPATDGKPTLAEKIAE